MVMPRDPARGEHVDDHQLRSALWLGDQAVVIHHPSELAAALERVPPRGAPQAGRSDRASRRLSALCAELISGA